MNNRHFALSAAGAPAKPSQKPASMTRPAVPAPGQTKPPGGSIGLPPGNQQISTRGPDPFNRSLYESAPGGGFSYQNQSGPAPSVMLPAYQQNMGGGGQGGGNDRLRAQQGWLNRPPQPGRPGFQQAQQQFDSALRGNPNLPSGGQFGQQFGLGGSRPAIDALRRNAGYAGAQQGFQGQANFGQPDPGNQFGTANAPADNSVLRSLVGGAGPWGDPSSSSMFGSGPGMPSLNLPSIGPGGRRALGAALGGAVGGPLGALAGGWLGGRMGGGQRGPSSIAGDFMPSYLGGNNENYGPMPFANAESAEAAQNFGQGAMAPGRGFGSYRGGAGNVIGGIAPGQLGSMVDMPGENLPQMPFPSFRR